jgi:hypothetical protein
MCAVWVFSMDGSIAVEIGRRCIGDDRHPWQLRGSIWILPLLLRCSFAACALRRGVQRDQNFQNGWQKTSVLEWVAIDPAVKVQ